MDTATAFVDDETLDLIQVATAPVPLYRFRLLPDCSDCQALSTLPATKPNNFRIRDHVLSGHADLVIVSSD